MNKYLKISYICLGLALAGSAQASGKMNLTITNSCSQTLCYSVGGAFNGTITNMQGVTKCSACGTNPCIQPVTVGKVLITIKSKNNQAQLDFYTPKGGEFIFITAYGNESSPDCDGNNNTCVNLIKSTQCSLTSSPSMLWNGSTFNFSITHQPK